MELANSDEDQVARLLANPPTAKALEEIAAFCADLKLVEEAASIFRRRNDDVGLQWLDHVIASDRNHAVEVIGHLRARDGNAAVRAFNKGRARSFALSATRRRRSATTAPDPITCCPPGAPRGSRRRSVFTTSRNAPAFSTSRRRRRARWARSPRRSR